MILLTATALCLGLQGPAGWWRGDDGTTPTVAADSSGNNRPGTYTSGATTSTATFPPGLFNNDSVFQFDGSDDQVTVPHNAAFNLTGDMTVAFWVRKTSEATDYVRYVGKGNPTNRTFGVWDENSGGGLGGKVLFQQYNAGTTVVSYYSVGSIGLNTWTHVACTVKGNDCVIYLNGQNSNPNGGLPVVRSGPPNADAQPVRFGYGEIHAYHIGQMDEVRLFNRELTLAEIQTLAGLTPSAVPGNLRTQSVSVGTVTLAWDAATGANTYVVQRSDPVAGPFNTIATGITGTTYTDSGLTPGATYTYVVYAVGLVNSADSTPHAVTIPLPPPRTEDHEEGLLGENCSCGAAGRGTSALWALAALLVLGTRLRRL
jgi:hypothetical protein